MKTFNLTAGELSISSLRELYFSNCSITLDQKCFEKINAAYAVVNNVIRDKKTVYGINTGFGLLANTKISEDQLEILQRNIVLSHAAGVGEFLSDDIVALILLLKINSLAQGYSGVSQKLVNALLALLNNKVYPCIPEKGSVGASGDLAPLAHMCCPLLGEGHVRYQGKIMPATEGLKIAGLSPIVLQPKEGLALLNGTQVSTALALKALFQTENLFDSALITGSLSIDALKGSLKPFDPRIHQVRRHKEQQIIAKIISDLLQDSAIQQSHHYCSKVQDPYSLRCQPQVMGACLQQIRHASTILENEANAVTDNPLVFTDNNEIISGGNFHAEPVALVADNLALAITEIASIAERRIAILVDPKMSDLPAFLVENSGINSGFMLAQVTAAAVLSENKMLAHPGSVDSIPTSANQEDHVSMATHSARRLLAMIDNSNTVIAIEYLASCQGIDFHAPLKTSTPLQQAHQTLRDKVAHYCSDRYFYEDIAAAKKLIYSGVLSELIDHSSASIREPEPEIVT
jgi:histidine ammonia-lyase